MTDESLSLPLTEVVVPENQDEMARQMKHCFEQSQAVYPLGGETSLHYGLPATVPGLGLSTKSLNQIVDFPERDLTITVEAGIPMKTLSGTLAAAGLMLPLDVPQAASASLGAVIATNTNGPRRFGLGTVRDYVIGIQAINGKGQTFNGGGRVVKNVAGYDFCKLLTGSMGTLGIITQVTLKVKPIAEKTTTILATVPAAADVEPAIEHMLVSGSTPVALEWLVGTLWEDLLGIKSSGSGFFAVKLAGTNEELAWSESQVLRELEEAGLCSGHIIDQPQQDQLWAAVHEFPAKEVELMLQIKTVSSGVISVVQTCREIDEFCTIQATAGDGVVTVAFDKIPDTGVSGALIAQLAPIAARFHGHVETFRNRSGSELTSGSVWGRLSAPQFLQERIKEQFDPRGLLNPGRFVFQ